MKLAKAVRLKGKPRAGPRLLSVQRSTPHRDSVQTWEKVVDLLTQGAWRCARRADVRCRHCQLHHHGQGTRDSAITAKRRWPAHAGFTRLYDENAIDGADAKEDALGYDALIGDWKLSMPCATDDLAGATGPQGQELPHHRPRHEGDAGRGGGIRFFLQADR